MRVKYLLDADLPRALFTGLRRADSAIDVVRVQQVGLREAEDPDVLRFAAADGRIVVTKDKRTMRDFAAERVRDGEPMPGLLVVRPKYLRGLAGIGVVIRELVRIDETTELADWEHITLFIPPLKTE